MLAGELLAHLDEDVEHRLLGGRRKESFRVAAMIWRIGGRGPSERTTMSSRTDMSARSGMNEAPTPAATKPCMAK